MSRDVTTAGHDYIRLLAGVSAELWPDTDTLGAVLDGLFHVQILQMILLVCDNNVDVVV